MREINFGCVSQRNRRTAMVGVTGTASQPRIIFQENSVQGGRSLLLAGDIRMTGQAVGSHTGRLPERHMAGGAIRSQAGM